MINAVVDTGFWYALYDGRDVYHDVASDFMSNHCDGLHFLIPFPTLYETINTRFVKQRNHHKMRHHINSDRCTLIHDEEYKIQAYDATFTMEHLSLVDMVIRLMIEDPNLRIDAVLTFNPGDFIDVCQARGVEILPIQH